MKQGLQVCLQAGHRRQRGRDEGRWDGAGSKKSSEERGLCRLGSALGPCPRKALTGHPRQQSPKEEEGGPGQVSLGRSHGGRTKGEGG